MNVVDMGMVGHLGANALAAVGMGSMLVWVFISMGISLRTATQTLSSRRLGQQKFSECGTAFRNGFVLAIIFGCSISVLGYMNAEQIVSYFMSDPNVIPMCNDYTSIGYLSVYFMVASFVFQGFYTGVEKTKFLMTVNITSNVINVYLNAGLIYGSEGVKSFFSETIPALSFLSYLWQWTSFPAMGVKGAAIATLVASLWMSVHYGAYLFSKQIKTRFAVFSLSVDRVMMNRQLRLAAPQGLQEMFIAVGWSMFYKIVGMIGLIELATTELLFTIMHASFMPALGVGQACSTLVSKYMGEKKIEKSETSIKESIRLAEYIMGVMGLSFILFPKYYLFIFTDDPEIIRLGVFGLRMIGAVQFLDAIGFVLWFALSGAGNTLFPAVVESCLTWGIIVLGSYVFGVVLGMGFKAPWLLFPVYMGLFAGIMVWKIRKGDWKKIEV